MPDLADLSQIQQERLEQVARKRAPAAPPATGFCFFCGEPLPDGKRWCNAECRDDWERLDASLRQRGL